MMIMELKKHIKKHEKELVNLLKKLVEQDTTNPPGNEYKIVDIVEKFFKDNDIRYEKHEKVNNRPNIIGRIGKEGPKILVACHSDVVPAGDGWTMPAFKPTIKKGRMYGRGTIDNKGPMASMLILAKILKSFEKKLNGEIIFAVVADEEAGSNCGMKYLIKEKIIDIDYAIIPDISGNCLEIDIAEKGALFVNVTAYGKQAHGSRPNLGINAITNMMGFDHAIRKSEFLTKKNKLLGKSTINLGKIEGGVKHNLVAGKCVAGYDIRYIPETDENKILKELKEIASKIGDFGFQILTHHEPTQVNPDNAMVKAIQKNSKKVLGKKAKLIGLSGATVCKELIKEGIPAIGYSAGDDELVHCADENIKIQELYDFAEIMGYTLLDVLG